MKRLLSLALSVCALATVARAQNAALLPTPRQQFFDANGYPLAGGLLYSCTAGSSCPGAPLATYTDATAGTANANPIVLDAAGRANVWLGSGSYKLVLQDQYGATVWTQDNVSSTSLKAVTATGGAVSNFNVPGTLTVGTLISGPLRDFKTVRDYGAKGDGSTNDTTAIQAAMAACSGGTIWFPATSANVYVVNLTLSVPSGCTVRGSGGGSGETSQTIAGAAVKWTGATSTPVFLFHDVAHSALDGLGIDCSNVSGCIGIQYDSDNAPPSSLNSFTNFTIKGAHQGVVVGIPGNTNPGAAACNSNPNQSGCYQADTFAIRNFNIYGNCSDTTAEGIHINSANAAQGSTIEIGNIQCVNQAVHIVATNGGLDLARVNAGSSVGTSPTMFLFDAGVVWTPNLLNDESEGTWTYAVHDSSCNPLGSNGTPVWIGNSFNNNILVDGCEQITSLGDYGSGTWTVNGPAGVNSMSVGKWQAGTGSPKIITANLGGLTGSVLTASSYIRSGTLSPPGSLATGDIMAARSSTSGLYWFGNDGVGYLVRNAAGEITSGNGYYGKIRTGSAGNTDNAGTIAFAGGGSTGSYTFAGTYSTAPVCSVTPQNGIGTVTYSAAATTTTLTVTTSANVSNTFSYVCFPRN